MQLHAAVTVDGRDRSRLERICRYLLRPPFAQDAIQRTGDGQAQSLRGHLRRLGTGRCGWTGAFSEEDPSFLAPIGQAIQGVFCSGEHCENKHDFVCDV